MKPTILLLAGILMLALCAEGKSSRRVPANEPATLRVHDALFPAPYGLSLIHILGHQLERPLAGPEIGIVQQLSLRHI